MKTALIVASASLLGLVSCQRTYNQGGSQTKEAARAGTPTPNAQNSQAVFMCESYGAKLVVSKYDNPYGRYTAVLSGTAAEMIRDEQGKDVVVRGGGYDDGRSWTAKKQLPNHYAYKYNFDKAGEPPAVTMIDLNRNDYEGKLSSFSSSQYGPNVSREANGFKLTFEYHEMTGSHSTKGYKYADWYFAEKDCKDLAQAGSPSTPPAPSTDKSEVVLTCESYGAKLVLTKKDDNYTGLLTGKAAEMIRDEQGKDVAVIGGGYDSGKTWPGKKRLPSHYQYVFNFDKAGEPPAVKMVELRRNELDGKLWGYTSSQYGPEIRKEATGYKAVVTFFEMTGSHNTASYEYANWFFADKDCK